MLQNMKRCIHYKFTTNRNEYGETIKQYYVASNIDTVISYKSTNPVVINEVDVDIYTHTGLVFPSVEISKGDKVDNFEVVYVIESAPFKQLLLKEVL